MPMECLIYIDGISIKINSKRCPSTLEFSQGNKRLDLDLVTKIPTNFSSPISITYCYVVLKCDRNMLVMIRKNGFEMTKILRNG